MRRVELTAIGIVVAAGLVAGCASSPWPKSRSQIVTTAPACEDFAVQIYFERDSAEVTSEARSVLKSAEALTKGCKVDSVRVLGLADAVGASDVNLALSKKRATAVTGALAKVGFRDVEFDVAAAGDTGSITGSGEARPLRRRADVKFDLAAPSR
ncbi:flagellar motor protein MotB [Caulobacter sp. Root655]|uniref:OmpA family protein n=1 Tax=Caulobacter sp. Root655 TaxID=1736578 RepID=UPI0006FB22DD|nr:OmpA family protein [Caulobacter sp. Root655]KRA56189.1 flagellar motor protein MotB [Caulobacter sp. Root655]